MLGLVLRGEDLAAELVEVAHRVLHVVEVLDLVLEDGKLQASLLDWMGDLQYNATRPQRNIDSMLRQIGCCWNELRVKSTRASYSYEDDRAIQHVMLPIEQQSSSQQYERRNHVRAEYPPRQTVQTKSTKT